MNRRKLHDPVTTGTSALQHLILLDLPLDIDDGHSVLSALVAALEEEAWQWTAERRKNLDKLIKALLYGDSIQGIVRKLAEGLVLVSVHA
jgi:hypothetical protein